MAMYLSSSSSFSSPSFPTFVQVGTVYPTYKSFKAIESREKDDDTKWLTYWVIFATLQNLEFFSAYIVFWIPFYQPLRMALLVWCMLPIPANGSKVLYDQVIKKFFLKHQVDIDGLASKAAKVSKCAHRMPAVTASTCPIKRGVDAGTRRRAASVRFLNT